MAFIASMGDSLSVSIKLLMVDRSRFRLSSALAAFSAFAAASLATDATRFSNTVS